ncbi:MAG: hypothetical protein M3Y87_19075 [Myxococcota bacterium]|nr:hypothetical protein [Myxococcota bacterium]
MRRVRGRISSGRLLVDEPTSLPDGEVSLVVLDDGDEPWPEALDAELASRAAEVEAGRYHTLEEVLEILRTDR